MRATPRRHLSYATFLALLVLDAVALVSFLLVQVLGVPLPIAWLAAGLLTVLATPALLRLHDEPEEPEAHECGPAEPEECRRRHGAARVASARGCGHC